MNHLFYEIFERLPRIGPGCNLATIMAFNTINSNKNLNGHLNILDIGCGTGIHTIQLAKLIRGRMTALDNHQGFLDSLES